MLGFTSCHVLSVVSDSRKHARLRQKVASKTIMPRLPKAVSIYYLGAEW